VRRAPFRPPRKVIPGQGGGCAFTS
jgi:hypothetical protein